MQSCEVGVKLSISWSIFGASAKCQCQLITPPFLKRSEAYKPLKSSAKTSGESPQELKKGPNLLDSNIGVGYYGYYSDATKDFGVFESPNASSDLHFTDDRKPGVFGCVTVGSNLTIPEGGQAMPVKTNLKAGQLTISLTATASSEVYVVTYANAAIEITLGGGDDDAA